MLALRVRAVGSASAHGCQHEGHPLLRTALAIATSGGMPASGLAALPARARTSAAAGDRGSAGSVRTLNAIVPGDPPALAVAGRRCGAHAGVVAAADGTTLPTNAAPAANIQ